MKLTLYTATYCIPCQSFKQKVENIKADLKNNGVHLEIHEYACPESTVGEVPRLELEGQVINVGDCELVTSKAILQNVYICMAGILKKNCREN
jgi:hypothetical protein